MRMSALFGIKKLGILNLWCVRTDNEGEPVRTFCGQEGRGSIFRDVLRTSLLTAP